eukprot:14666726-Alexandrium_andersonii.AAC.1
MSASLVGSEMCIRDSTSSDEEVPWFHTQEAADTESPAGRNALISYGVKPVSYTHLTLPTICSV